MERIFTFLLSIAIMATAYAQSATTSNFRVDYNKVINGIPHIEIVFDWSVYNVEGHSLRPVLFVDRAKGQPHYWANGQQMGMNGQSCMAQSNSWGWQGAWFNISHRDLNALPGQNEYNARILVLDETTNTFLNLNENNWITFTMTGARQLPQYGSGGYLHTQTYMNGVQVIGNSYVGGSTTTTQYRCGACGATGDCTTCRGTGRYHTGRPCGVCGGSGKCSECHGHGWIR